MKSRTAIAHAFFDQGPGGFQQFFKVKSLTVERRYGVLFGFLGQSHHPILISEYGPAVNVSKFEYHYG